jgi:hypothetical protein
MGQGLLAGPAGEVLGLGVGVGVCAVWFDVVHDIPSTNKPSRINPISAFAESIRMTPP